ncbi:MAG: efflux RND transporter permease subunit, partial [Bacteroidales bacterium]|nr:efflux RND transporter permease subunit [Bacteroidales bacterium]
LGGIAIAIGSLVDDAIVDVENVYKRLRHNSLLPEVERRPVIKVVYDASREVRLPILNSSLIIIASFLPRFFLQHLFQSLDLFVQGFLHFLERFSLFLARLRFSLRRRKLHIRGFLSVSGRGTRHLRLSLFLFRRHGRPTLHVHFHLHLVERFRQKQGQIVQSGHGVLLPCQRPTVGYRVALVIDIVHPQQIVEAFLAVPFQVAQGLARHHGHLRLSLRNGAYTVCHKADFHI